MRCVIVSLLCYLSVCACRFQDTGCLPEPGRFVDERFNETMGLLTSRMYLISLSPDLIIRRVFDPEETVTLQRCRLLSDKVCFLLFECPFQDETGAFEKRRIAFQCSDGRDPAHGVDEITYVETQYPGIWEKSFSFTFGPGVPHLYFRLLNKRSGQADK